MAVPNSAAAYAAMTAAQRAGSTNTDTAYSSTRAPAVTDIIREGVGYGMPVNGSAAQAYANQQRASSQSSAPKKATSSSSRSSGSSSSGSRGYSYSAPRRPSGPSAAQINAQKAAAVKANTLQQAAFMLNLLNSDAYKFHPNDAARTRANGAVDADIATANGANDQLVSALTALQANNPYAALHANAPTVDPQLSALIAAQGGDTSGYQNEVNSLNQLGNTLASNWNGLYAAQDANRTQSNQSQMAQAAMGRTQNQAELNAQRQALLSIIDQQDAAKQAAQQQQSLQLIAQIQQLFGGANQSLIDLGQKDMMTLPTLQQLGLA